MLNITFAQWSFKILVLLLPSLLRRFLNLPLKRNKKSSTLNINTYQGRVKKIKQPMTMKTVNQPVRNRIANYNKNMILNFLNLKKRDLVVLTAWLKHQITIKPPLYLPYCKQIDGIYSL